MLLFHFKTLKSTHCWLQQHFFEIVDGTSSTSIPCAGVTTDKQTEGREGIEWLVLPGTLSCSLLVPIAEHISRKDWGLFSLIGANSLCTTLKDLIDLDADSDEIWTDWPGSVMSKMGKLGTILTDTMENPLENIWFVLISFSVNLNHSLACGSSQESLSETCILKKFNSKQISTEKCFLALYKQIARDFKMFFAGKIDPLLATVRKWARQEPCIRFNHENETVTGRLLEILEDGGALIKLSCGKQTVFSSKNISKIECISLSNESSTVDHYSRA